MSREFALTLIVAAREAGLAGARLGYRRSGPRLVGRIGRLRVEPPIQDPACSNRLCRKELPMTVL
ncbi:hypothetical protein SAMN05421763_11292 [[Luteovulum] sphaeroides subsp. megalophilum]|nr:hypothetical protein SAMN05421763_11292 [[Luteovulum] sphaeroides subsp. megalophilum]